MTDLQQLRLPDGRLVVPRAVEPLLGRLISDAYKTARQSGQLGEVDARLLEFTRSMEVSAAEFAAATELFSSGIRTAPGATSRLEVEGSASGVFSVKVAADLVGCTARNVTRAIQRGQLAATKPGGHDWLISEVDLNKWRHNRRANRG